jgi:DNA-directed RNA polymerase subunit RPC12/RpoP
MPVKLTYRCFKCNNDVTETRTDTIAALIEEGFPFMCLDCNGRWRAGMITTEREVVQLELFAELNRDGKRYRKRGRGNTPTKPT